MGTGDGQPDGWRGLQRRRIVAHRWLVDGLRCDRFAAPTERGRNTMARNKYRQAVRDAEAALARPGVAVP